MRVCMGGTFDVLHRGHEALLDAAFAVGDERVSVGVTTDEFANAHRARTVRPWDERAGDVRRFLGDRGYADRSQIRAIDTSVGFAYESQYTAIVVTDETLVTARAINEERERRGLARLEIVVVPRVVADDGDFIRATRIRSGEIDRLGGSVMRAE